MGCDFMHIAHKLSFKLQNCVLEYFCSVSEHDSAKIGWLKKFLNSVKNMDQWSCHSYHRRKRDLIDQPD